MASRVRIKGLSGLRTDVRALSTDVETGTMRAQEAVAEALADMIAADAPVDTGRLRRSVDAVGDEVIIDVDYAEFVEDDQAFIQPNIDAMRREGAKIAGDALEREIG